MKTTFEVKHRRRREGKTDYKKRLALLKSGKKRIVIRKSNKYINIQLIETINGVDKTISALNSKKLIEFGWPSGKNTPAAYLVGYAFGKKIAKEKDFIIDFGRQTALKKSKLYAIIKGLIDSGIKLNVSEEVLPTEDRITGKHIEEYAKKLGEKATKVFSEYMKKNFQLDNLTKTFNEVKNNIDKKFSGDINAK